MQLSHALEWEDLLCIGMILAPDLLAGWAGLVDGDGCIQFGFGRGRQHLLVNIKQEKCPELLEALQIHHGCGRFSRDGNIVWRGKPLRDMILPALLPHISSTQSWSAYFITWLATAWTSTPACHLLLTLVRRPCSCNQLQACVRCFAKCAEMPPAVGPSA